MKCLFLSVKKWESEVTHLATRGKNIITDSMREGKLLIEDACVVLVTYEDFDNTDKTDLVIKNIIKESRDLGKEKILITPFAHLSSKLGDASDARNFLDVIITKINEEGLFCMREHFGSDKEVELILNSHPGCVRFREY